MIDHNREYQLRRGARPVINIDGEELGLARNVRGAQMIVVRLCNVVGISFSVSDITVTDVGTHWQV